jgi:hypothetical protein
MLLMKTAHIIMAGLLVALAITTTRAQTNGARVFLLDGARLRESKARITAGDKTLEPALIKLEADAKKAVEGGSFSVTTKTITPPSGDKHDYMSQAPYFWADPKSANGLPYIRKDGERNPEINKISDHRSLDQLISSVETLALAYYFRNNEAYAQKAAQLLRAFFLDPSTRMNPNLEYAQGIPGVNTGRGIGLIETRGLTRVVDAIGLLEGSKALTASDRRGLEAWFAKFLQWMLESKNGRDEAAAKNNHGTYYDLQVVSFALFLGKQQLATSVLQTARGKRIAVQIEPDGRQPLELARTRAWGYSVGNLDGLMQLARLGENVGVDLWNYQTADGRSIRKAFDFLLPFAIGEKQWPYPQLGEWPPEMLFPLARLAAAKYHEPALLSKVPKLDRDDRGNLFGAPATVTHAGKKWTIGGRKHQATIDETDLSIVVQAGSARWTMLPSMAGDMIVKGKGDAVSLRLADAKKITVVPYETGFRTGVKISLSDWVIKTNPIDLQLFLTVGFEGSDDELVFDVAATEGNFALRQLDWPGALDSRDIDYTLLSNGRGTLLPRNWPKEYYPIRNITREGKIAASDHSLLQSHVIESWSMSWWGFQRGRSGMMVIVETPDDAAYQFSHPAGGPTVVGPRWRSQLDKFGYVRSARVVFIAAGNYVDMAKRYRRYVQESGLFVSLQEKIARTPAVKDLIATPQTRVSILRNLKQDSDRYDTADASKNYSLNTFDERAKQIRELKAKGFDRALILVSGWAHLGYDRQHPDPLPPPEQAGGWEGMKRLVETCRELNYPVIFHDQYRDYYLDAPSYDEQFAVHEEDASQPPQQFPGSRFGDSKQGQIPFMRHWDGGKQAYLNARFQLGHLLKNYQLFFDHGIRPQGIYIDVIGYVPPDQDFNPQHPTTHTDAMNAQAAMLNWSRRNLGIIATEAGADWVVPYVDTINSSGGGSKAILLPLYQLVYHDAVITSFGARDEKSLLQGLLFGGVPEWPIQPATVTDKMADLMKQMLALHKRVGLLELTKHEFLDANYRRERTTFADGTTVTVDWEKMTVNISPDLTLK